MESAMKGYKNDPYWVEIQQFLPEKNKLTERDLPQEYYLPLSAGSIHIDHYRPDNPKGRIILFHGIGGNGRLLSFIALPLARNGFEVICPDMPLYGYTLFSQPVTYDTWVLCGTEIVRHYQAADNLPTFLFGLSAGGMLAYQVANECQNIKGLIVTCILDQRNPLVTRQTANNPFMGIFAKSLLKAVHGLAGNVKLPMKWVANMKAITNNKALATLLMKDKKSSGTMVPIAFIHSMLHPHITVEPEDFNDCPFLLVHPGDDRWTKMELSKLFYNR